MASRTALREGEGGIESIPEVLKGGTMRVLSYATFLGGAREVS